MSNRMLAAGIFVLGIGMVAAPPETSAGSFGRMAAPALPLVNPGHPVPNLPPQTMGGIRRHFGAFRTSRLHDQIESGLSPWWGYAGYGSDYYPYDYAASNERPVYLYPPYENFSERSRPPVYYQPGCRTDTQQVASEAGGERTITITRCY